MESQRTDTKRISVVARVIGATAFVLIVVSYRWWAPEIGLQVALPEVDELRKSINTLGMLGPLAVIGLMALAIVLSPIPSAPIALTAGAAYGHLWGTIYVAAGAELGALLAFGIARILGYELIQRLLGSSLNTGLQGSQNFLMGTVFVSRLLPFISFDIVSYAAGLTPLSFWRFAIATLAGIIPASFLLAHFGSELLTDEIDRIAIALLFLGLLAGIPLVTKLATKLARK